jgi:hypothetical protein
MYTVFDPERHISTLSDLDAVLLEAEQLKILPAATLAKIDQTDLLFWCFQRAIYGLPSVELVDWLRAKIAGRSAIEIGAGNGALARALGIPATDSWMQAKPEIERYYRSIGQTPISYAPDVERLDARAAIKKYQPDVVVGSWITHRYMKERPELGGNAEGVDEHWVIEQVETYIFIGAQSTHHQKPILELPHERLAPIWLFGRGKPNERFIAVWNNKNHRRKQ